MPWISLEIKMYSFQHTFSTKRFWMWKKNGSCRIFKGHSLATGLWNLKGRLRQVVSPLRSPFKSRTKFSRFIRVRNNQSDDFFKIFLSRSVVECSPSRWAIIFLQFPSSFLVNLSFVEAATFTVDPANRIFSQGKTRDRFRAVKAASNEISRVWNTSRGNRNYAIIPSSVELDNIFLQSPLVLIMFLARTI